MNSPFIPIPALSARVRVWARVYPRVCEGALACGRLPARLMCMWLVWGVGLSACETSQAPVVPIVDATAYFPLELGRVWLLYDSADRFLRLETSREVNVGGVPCVALTLSFDFDPTEGAPVPPAYELYLAEEEAGVRVFGAYDGNTGNTWTYLPGGVLAGRAMAWETPVTTATAAAGQAVTYRSTWKGEGMIRTWYGDFPEGIWLEAGIEGETPWGWYLAKARGPVKLEWDGALFQLYAFQ